MILIAISEPEYKGLVKRAFEAIKIEFDQMSQTGNFIQQHRLIKEAEAIGCLKEDVLQLKKDL